MKHAKLFSLGLCSLLLLNMAFFFVRAETEKTHGGTLIAVIPTDPRTLNPATTTSMDTQGPISGVMESLISVDWNFDPQPMLAQSWEISDDGLTYTFHLVQNATWHDGISFTSADVKFTFEEVTRSYHPTGKSVFACLDHVETPDDYTAVVKLKYPFAPLMKCFLGYIGYILPKHLYEGTDILTNPYNEKPVGTGPYIFEEWVKGSHITIKRNPDYWGRGTENKPYLDRIKTVIIPDPAARITAIEAGDVDFIHYHAVPLTEVAEGGKFTQNPDITIVWGRGMGTVFSIFFNHNSDIMKDHRVREALYRATDVDEIFLGAFSGVGARRDGPFSDLWGAYFNSDADARSEYGYDLEMAGHLLDNAGYPKGSDGIRFSISIAYYTTSTGAGTPEILKEQWKKIGVTLDLNTMDYATFLDVVFRSPREDTTGKDLTYIGYATGPDPQIGIERMYHSKYMDNGTWHNPGNIDYPEIDLLWDAAAVEANDTKRKEMYYDLQDTIVDLLPAIYISQQRYPCVIRNEFQDVITQPLDYNEPYLEAYWTLATQAEPETDWWGENWAYVVAAAIVIVVIITAVTVYKKRK